MRFFLRWLSRLAKRVGLAALSSLEILRGLRPRRVFFSSIVAVLVVAFRDALRRFRGDC
jgi:hypothetical protein